MNLELYYATNRNHTGKNRWKPDGYGGDFSGDGHYNLRFGKLTLKTEQAKVDKYLDQAYKGGRTGNGEGLSGYLAKEMKHAKLAAYKDDTAKKKVEFEANSSTRMFLDVKAKMQNGQNVLIFIHGYNVSWKNAAASALALQCMLNQKGDKPTVVILFSWPSDGSMMPFAAYKSDRSDARDSAQAVGRGFLKLRDFLGKLKQKPKPGEEHLQACNQSINLLCHSMGNYVLQNALGKLAGYANGNRMPRIFDNIFMCAADVDDDILEKGEKMGRLHEISHNISVYFNKGDLALSISDTTKGNPQRLGHTGMARPQMTHNNIEQINCSRIVSGMVEHSYFLWSTVNADIAQSINGVAPEDDSRKRKRIANGREWVME